MYFFFRIQDRFLTLIPLKDARAENLYMTITKFFETKNVPYKQNLVGFASDGASVMVGKHNSVVSRIKSDIPHIFIMKCISHSFHLCASNACQVLPRGIEDLVRDIYNYFANSPKRIETFKEFQNFAHTKIHKMLHPAQTRWLSLEAAVCRVLEQYDALNLFFIDAVANDRILAAENILIKLQDPFTKLYLQFLEYSLSFFNNLNRQMQSEQPKIHELHSSVSSIYKTFLESFIKREIILNVSLDKINYKDPSNFLPLDEMYLGAKVSISINSLTTECDKNTFRKRCLQFFIEAASQINQRFDFNDKVLIHICLLSPKNVCDKKNSSISPLAVHFPNLVAPNDLQILDNEWRLLRNTNLNVDQNNSIEEFWNTIEKMRHGDDSPMFPVLSTFVFNLLIFPHSSANVERTFSDVNLLKTNQRNKLSTTSIIGNLHVKTYLRSRNATCHSISFSKNILALHNNNMYKTINEDNLTDSASD